MTSSSREIDFSGTTPEELTLFSHLFDLMDEALLRVRSERIGNRTSHTKTTTAQLINQVERELGRRYKRARDGYPHLKRRDFDLLVEMISPYCPEQLVRDIKAGYEIYDRLDPEFNAKRSPRLGAGYIASKTVAERFRRMLETSEVTMPLLVRHPELYRHFINTWIEYPACAGLQGEAISNGFIICESLERLRSAGSPDVAGLSDVDFAAYLAHAARDAAWAAQQVGQKSRFIDFLHRLMRCDKTGGRHAAYCLNLILAHHNRQVSYLGGKHMKGGVLHAHMARRRLREDILGFTERDETTIAFNPARALITAGATLDTKSDKLDGRVIADLLEEGQEIAERNQATKIGRIEAHQLRALAHLNDGNIRDALIDIEAAAIVNGPDCDTNGTSYTKTSILHAKGLIVQRITGQRENIDLIEARRNAMRMGAFDRAMEIETHLGWRKPVESHFIRELRS